MPEMILVSPTETLSGGLSSFVPGTRATNYQSCTIIADTEDFLFIAQQCAMFHYKLRTHLVLEAVGVFNK